MKPRVVFSIVVSTLGRSSEIIRLLDSLEEQTERNFEVVIVDQNDDDRVTSALAKCNYMFPLFQIRVPGARGLSLGRNIGWREAAGEFVVFADDDCWYPSWLLSAARRKFEETGGDIISGRAADDSGRSINGRYETEAQRILRENVWTTSIEWMVFFRRSVLEELGGFDEAIGVGAPTPWQAAEGQDILLRALEHQKRAYFDPALYGHHAELDTVNPNESMRTKARSYGRGMGFVLRKHAFGLKDFVRWIGRPAAASMVYAIRLQPARSRYYLNVAFGRLEGFMRYAR